MTMPPRRLFLGTAAVALAAGAAAGRARAQGADPARATQFIQATGQEMVAALNANAPIAQRRQQVARPHRGRVVGDPGDHRVPGRGRHPEHPGELGQPVWSRPARPQRRGPGHGPEP